MITICRERIIELLAAAGGQTVEYAAEDLGQLTEGEWAIMETFVELIVKECRDAL